MQRPEEVIKINKEAYGICGKSVFSVPLYTSIAAAYCDLEEYEKARQFCDIAYAEQGGGIGIKTELSLVYQRIEKEMNVLDTLGRRKNTKSTNADIDLI